MFYVHGVQGRLFQGPLEELRRVEAVRDVVRAREGALFGADADAREGPDRAAPRAVDAPARNALAAYARSPAAPVVRHPVTTVAELMSRGALTVRAELSVLDAWRLLAARGFGQAPVVDGRGALVGLLTRADLLRPDRLPAPGIDVRVWAAFLARRVAEVMWTPVPGVAPETDIRRVASALLDTGLPGLPVVDEAGAVTGFLSRSDILRAVVHDPPLDLWT
ncbi:MAG: CBS domain-containing protein [Deltaproteobacteria bacterium]|nr:CBS domain-containing protein [Myxococcales bacterium]MDP3213958.1 CBS domain-containing protein [Deltaproteobacteria bacterium]